MTDLVSDLRNVTVIIRSVGERTEGVCRSLVLEQHIPESAVFIVNEKPFSQSMRRSFELGIEQARAWTLCVDADVLLRANAIADLLAIAKKQPENVCEIQGYILDKFFGGPRQAGNHLYRTKLLPNVIRFIPKEGTNIRPETHTLNAVRDDGYPWKQVQVLVGLHDFEQDFPDIFRKCFIQAHKHVHLTELLVSVWRKLAADDMDYQVALKGFSRGVEYFDDVYIDVNSPVFEEMYSVLGLENKAPLLESDWSLERVEAIISEWSDSDDYRNWFPTRAGFESTLSRCLIRKSTSTESNHSSRSIMFLVGWYIERLGKSLKKLSKS